MRFNSAARAIRAIADGMAAPTDAQALEDAAYARTVGVRRRSTHRMPGEVSPGSSKQRELRFVAFNLLDGACWLCGETMQESDMEVDSLYGGKNHRYHTHTVAGAHRSCNNFRGALQDRGYDLIGIVSRIESLPLPDAIAQLYPENNPEYNLIAERRAMAMLGGRG